MRLYVAFLRLAVVRVGLRLALCLVAGLAGLAGGTDASGCGSGCGSGSGDVLVVRVEVLPLALDLVADLAGGVDASGCGSGDVLVVRVDVLVVRVEVLPLALGLVVADLFAGAAVSGSGGCGDVDDTSIVTVPFVSGVMTATTI